MTTDMYGLLYIYHADYNDSSVNLPCWRFTLLMIYQITTYLLRVFYSYHVFTIYHDNYLPCYYIYYVI